jgi:hypothetical protein
MMTLSDLKRITVSQILLGMPLLLDHKIVEDLIMGISSQSVNNTSWILCGEISGIDGVNVGWKSGKHLTGKENPGKHFKSPGASDSGHTASQVKQDLQKLAQPPGN